MSPKKNKPSLPSNQKLVGYYCWAGPGTIRMLETKYFDPQIDHLSLLSSYDEPYLEQLKQKLGITDFWATHSWGFNPTMEQIDHQFLVKRTPNFKRHTIRLHAYLQGTNLVTNEFPDQDMWARDSFGRYMSYHRGRRLTCVNNPHFQKHFYSVVQEALQHDFDGIYIDNVNMGQMVPPIAGQPLFFVGCRCQYCLALFKQQTGLKIPRILISQPAKLVEQYLNFRAESAHTFLRHAADLAHAQGKLFGSNSFDPKFNPKLTYGYTYDQLAKFQDYLLFETHSFPQSDGTSKNQAADDWAYEVEVPVFALSYKNGISYDAGLSQTELELLNTDANNHRFHVCYKGSEFVTHGVWHNLKLEKVNKVGSVSKTAQGTKKPQSEQRQSKNQLKKWLILGIFSLPVVVVAANFLFGWLNHLIMEKKRVRPLMKVVYKRVVE